MKNKKGSFSSDQNNLKTSGLNSIQPAEEYSSFLALFTRFYWLLFGFLFEGIIALQIYKRENKILFTVIFWLIVLSIIFVRYIDIKYFKGLTSDNSEISTFGHLKSFSIKVVIISIFTNIGIYFF